MVTTMEGQTLSRAIRHRSRTDSEVQQRRNAETVRVTRIANGYSLTETGTGEIYSYTLLSEVFGHIEKFYSS